MIHKDLYSKYDKIFAYAVFGILTTIINLLIFYFLSEKFKIDIMISTVVAWIVAVGFAYITNKKYVFESKHDKPLFEVFKFYLSRLVTGWLDFIGVYIFIKLLSFEAMPTKILLNILIIILNFVFSKYFVFNIKKTKE
jgi:cell wall teichoic acid glycosylation protein gtcA